MTTIGWNSTVWKNPLHNISPVLASKQKKVGWVKEGSILVPTNKSESSGDRAALHTLLVSVLFQTILPVSISIAKICANLHPFSSKVPPGIYNIPFPAHPDNIIKSASGPVYVHFNSNGGYNEYG